MSLPRYPEYKGSGCEWIGSVPIHWSVQRLKTRVRLLAEKAVQRENPIALENIESWSGRLVASESTFEGDGVAFEAGDILFGKLRPYLAKVYLASHGGEAVGDFHVIRPSEGMVGRFVQYQLLNRIFIDVIDGSTFGSKMPRVSWETLGDMTVAVPSRSEQAGIAAFLDRETSKIDALITEQEKLIALLAEKRHATISHAVTRGLNSAGPTVESGVRFLGRIPSHWEVAPLMRLTDPMRPIMYGIVLPGPDVEGGVPIVKGGDVKEHRLRLELLNRTTPEIEAPYARARLAPGDIVYSIRGTIGDAEVVPEELRNANITQDVARISPDAGIQTRWLLHVMKSSPVFMQLEQRSLGAAVRGINIFELKRARIPVPPASERECIAAFLDSETAKLDAIETAASESIALLKERRSALITAAVTGQIDVRGVVPQPAPKPTPVTA